MQEEEMMRHAAASFLHSAVRRGWNVLEAGGRKYRLARLAEERRARRRRRRRTAAERAALSERVFVLAQRGGGAAWRATGCCLRRRRRTSRRGGGVPSYLALGLTVDALRASLELPDEALAIFHKAGGYFLPDLKGSTGGYGYGNPKATVINGYVNQHFLHAANEEAGGTTYCERMQDEDSPHVGRATVYVSCARNLPMEKLIEVLEAYMEEHPEIDGAPTPSTRFWLFDYCTRSTRSGPRRRTPTPAA